MYLNRVLPVFASANLGHLQLFTSAISLLEVLVAPYRLGNHELAARYEALLTGSKGVDLVQIDRSQLEMAAQLRALHRLRTPDALQIAAALTIGCSSFITNDKRLPAIPGLSIIQLSDLQ